VAVDPLGAHVYVANQGSSDVSQLASSTNGTLLPLTPASVPAGVAGTDAPSALAVDPSGKYVYVVDNLASGGGVWQFAVGATGGLAPMSPASVAAGSFPQAIVVVGAYR